MVAKEVPLVMPKMSMTMTEGVFLTWHKAAGDEIREGEVVCEVSTDKVDMEVEAPVAGTLTRLLATPEDVVPVGEPIAYVAAESEDLLGGLFDPPAPEPEQVPAREPAPEGRAEPPPPTPAEVAADLSPLGSQAAIGPLPATPAAVSPPDLSPASPPPLGPPPDPAPEGRTEPLVAVAKSEPSSVSAVPAARRRAAERGIDLATITPTGPWNTIRLSDVDRRNTGRGRAAIARRMVASTQVPQFVLYRDLDLHETNQTHGWTVLLTHAFAAALRRHPDLNASWTGDTVQHHDHIGVALAVDTERGLLAPVLTDPDLTTLDTLATRIDDVATRARQGRLGLAELAAPATTTVSNLGNRGVTGFQTLLTPPQATALSIGAVEPKVVPVRGGIGVRLRCTVGLTVDHRVADGAAGARLLASLQELL